MAHETKYIHICIYSIHTYMLYIIYYIIFIIHIHVFCVCACVCVYTQYPCCPISSMNCFCNPFKAGILKKMFEHLHHNLQSSIYFHVWRAINDNGKLKALPPSIHLCSRTGSISNFISPWKPHLIFCFDILSIWIISFAMWLV